MGVSMVMRWWLAALVFASVASEARAQSGGLPLPAEPFVLTTPEYPAFGQSVEDCAGWPPIRDHRRGQEANPSSGGQERRANPACPAR
jgi:hypothetical protein